MVEGMPLFSREEMGDRLVEALRKMPGAPPTDEEFEREVDEECVRLWEKDRKEQEEREPTLQLIPRLFWKRDFTPNSLAEQTRREARIRLLKRQELLLLEQTDLELYHDLVLQNSTGVPGQERINYDGFCQVKSQLTEKFDLYFTPKVFLHFSRDEDGRIPILPLYQFIVCRDALLRKRITLGWYDYTGAGFLRESDLENFVQDEISNSPIISQLEKSFQTFYVCTAVSLSSSHTLLLRLVSPALLRSACSSSSSIPPGVARSESGSSSRAPYSTTSWHCARPSQRRSTLATGEKPPHGDCHKGICWPHAPCPQVLAVVGEAGVWVVSPARRGWQRNALTARAFAIRRRIPHRGACPPTCTAQDVSLSRP